MRHCRGGLRSRITTSRTFRLVGGLACAAIATSYVLFAYSVVFVRRIGPVVAVVDSRHGVHSGDVLGLAAALFGALFAWFAVLLMDEATAPGQDSRRRQSAFADLALQPIVAESRPRSRYLRP